MTSTLTQDLDGKTGMMQESMLKMPAGDRMEQNHISRVWDIIDKVRVGMLTTQFNGGLRARRKRYCNSSVKNTTPINGACRCSSHAGVSGGSS